MLAASLLFVPGFFGTKAGSREKGLFTKTERHDAGLSNFDIRTDKPSANKIAELRSRSARNAINVADIRDEFVRGEAELRRRVPTVKVEYNETLHIPEKITYLNPYFLIPRSLIAFGIIASLSVWYIYTCVRLDVGHVPEAGAGWARGLRERMRRGFRDERREIHSTHSRQGYMAVALAFSFAFGWIVLSWDLSMSLDLHFQSTMYGWWVFMGGWVAALASFTLITMAWRKYLDRYDMITEKHFHDLGKLCFAFTAFWGYLTFGQYLVIWYGNMGEETHWARLRLIHPWLPLTLVTVTLMFGPFFGLMSRAAKVYLPTMALFAFFTVFGLWFHRYLEIYPSIYYKSSDIPFGLWEIGVTLGFLGIWGFCYMSFMDAFPRMRVTLMTSPYRDEVQVPVNPETMEPLPAHE